MTREEQYDDSPNVRNLKIISFSKTPCMIVLLHELMACLVL